MPCNASHVFHLMLRFEHQDLGSAVHVAIRRMQRHLAGARPMRQEQQCKDATCGLEVMHPRRTLELRAQHRAAARTRMKTAPIAADSNPSSLSLAAAAAGSASPLPVGSGLKAPRGFCGLRVCAAAAQAAEMAARSSAEESDSIVRSCSAAGLGWISRCGPPHDRLCTRHWRVRRQCTRVTSASARHRAQAQARAQCNAVQCTRADQRSCCSFGSEGSRGTAQCGAVSFRP
jgi:hypothetical protein